MYARGQPAFTRWTFPYNDAPDAPMFVHDRGKLVITLVGVAFSVTLVFAQVGLNTPGPCAQSHTTGQLS